MKAPVDRAATRRVLADIADAVRPVESARTAAAVERVLATASHGHGPDPSAAAGRVTLSICADLGVEPAELTLCTYDCAAVSECRAARTLRESATPNLVTYPHPAVMPDDVRAERDRYAPWVVSPHLFGGAP